MLPYALLLMTLLKVDYYDESDAIGDTAEP